jgi:hypothetical protein
MLLSDLSSRQKSGYPSEEDGDGRNPSGTTGDWRVLVRMRERYERAPRGEKGRLLDEVCEVTGYHRKAVIRRLRPATPQRRGRRGRPPRYGADVFAAVQAIWRAAGYPWSVRLKALIPAWLPWARRRLRLTPAVEEQLRRISARQIDRRLQPQKRQLAKRLYGRTKPGVLLKHHIPLQTERWNVTTPGFTEIDLVSHSGDCAAGEFLHSLNVPTSPRRGSKRRRPSSPHWRDRFNHTDALYVACPKIHLNI